MDSQRLEGRLFVFDLLRGIAISLMVVYHLFFLLAYEFNSPLGAWGLSFLDPVQPFIAGTFIFICGVFCRVSHSNTRRGLILLGCALLISSVTYLLTYLDINLFISFGILHFLAICVLLFAGYKKLVYKKEGKALLAMIVAILATVLFVILYTFQPLNSFPTTASFPLFAIGLPSTLGSADYFPLIPWGFLFIAGAFFGIVTKNKTISTILSHSIYTPLEWLGRKSLLVYMAHQVLIYAILLVVYHIISTIQDLF